MNLLNVYYCFSDIKVALACSRISMIYGNVDEIKVQSVICITCALFISS